MRQLCCMSKLTKGPHFRQLNEKCEERDYGLSIWLQGQKYLWEGVAGSLKGFRRQLSTRLPRRQRVQWDNKDIAGRL